MSDNDQKLITVDAVCLTMKSGTSKKSGKPYTILNFLTADNGGEFLDVFSDVPFPPQNVTSFEKLIDGEAVVGKLTMEKSFFNRKLGLRYKQFEPR